MPNLTATETAKKANYNMRIDHKNGPCKMSLRPNNTHTNKK